MQFLLAFLLTGCAVAPKLDGEICSSIYDPHLCMIVDKDKVFASHGSNRCVGMKKLKKKLEENKHKPILPDSIKCERVHK